MGIETPEKLGGSQDGSFLSGSLIPKWLHEKVTGVWGRLTHALDKFKSQKDAGILKRVGSFITGLFEDYKGLTQESIKAREETAKKATDIISQSASAEDVQKTLESYVFDKKELSSEEKDASDTLLGVASRAWLESPEKYDVTVVANSMLSDKPDVDAKDITLEQKLATVKFGLQYVKALQKHCKEKGISAEDLAKKIDKLEGLGRFKSKLQKVLSVDVTSVVMDNPLKLVKLNRMASQIPFDKLQQGKLEKSDVASVFPNTSANSEVMEVAVRAMNSAAKGQKVPTIDVARLALGIHERDLENLMQLVS